MLQYLSDGILEVELSWLIGIGEVIKQYLFLRIADFRTHYFHLRQRQAPLGASLFRLMDPLKRMTLSAARLQDRWAFLKTGFGRGGRSLR